MTNAANKTDLNSFAVYEDGAWKAMYRLPWITLRHVLDGDKHKTFKTKAEAAQGGADEVYKHLRDKTTGFITEPLSTANSEAEIVFKNFTGNRNGKKETQAT